MIARGVFQIREIGFGPIANVEKIPQHRNRITLLTGTQQFTYRDVQRFSEEIQQRGFQRGDSIHAQFERPGAFAERIKIGGLIAFMHLLNHFV
ncbi:hypothetical protein D3C72_2129280 [compost metagenome]